MPLLQRYPPKSSLVQQVLHTGTHTLIAAAKAVLTHYLHITVPIPGESIVVDQDQVLSMHRVSRGQWYQLQLLADDISCLQVILLWSNVCMSTDTSHTSL